MEPKLLMQLATVVSLGSVSKAARRLNVTQPTLSRSIKVIEDRVGGPVLRRGRYGVTPTEIGQRLADEGHAIQERSDRAKNAIDEWKQGLTGELRVGVGPMIAATFLGDFLLRLMEKKPGYAIRVFSVYASHLIDQLNKGELDLAIMPAQLNLHQEKLFQETLFSDRLAVFTSSEDPLTRKTSIPVEALNGRKWISSATTSGVYGATKESLEQMGLSSEIPIIEFTGGIITTCRVVSGMNACCFLPLRLGAMLDKSMGVAPLNVDRKLPPRDVAIWTRKDGRDRLEIQSFTRQLRDYLGSLPNFSNFEE